MNACAVAEVDKKVDNNWQVNIGEHLDKNIYIYIYIYITTERER